MSIRTRRKPMRAVAAAVAAAVGASLLAISAPTGVGAAPSVTEQTRIAGADRYATANAVALAKVGTGNTVNTVVLVSGENFPDGLAASALAGALNAPMLLTQAAGLPTSVLATLTTITGGLAGKNIVIVGGTTAVSADIATELTALGATVTRLSGDDRYGTANAVAAAVRTNNGGAIGTFGASNLRTAFLANGNNFPDALAASSWAYRNKHPLFLTNGTTLSDETKAAMTAAGVQQVIILGGTTAVSADVATAVAGTTGVIASTRVSGDDRYATATALATTLATVDTDYRTRAMLVSGTNFPDALVAAQLAGAADSYAIIPVNDPLPAAVSTWVTANQATLTTIRAIGGTEAVPADIVTEVKTGATTAPLSATITALDGGSTFSVVFSAAVTAASAGNIANYRVTSALGAAKTVTLNTAYNTTTRTVVMGVTEGLAAGDTVQLLGSSVVSSVTAGLFVAASSATVAADTAAPVVTIVAYPTTVGATPVDPSAAQRVWVTFSSNTNLTTGVNVESMLEADLKYTAPTIGTPPASVFAAGCSAIAGTTTYVCNVTTGSLVAGGTISLAAAKVTSSASTPVNNAATSVTIAADATAPSISSVRFTQAGSGTGAVQASRGVARGAVTISARAGTATDGKAGNAVKVATVLSPADLPSCTYSSTLNTVTISSTATVSALLVANACNALPAFNALFVAAAHASNPTVSFWADSAATAMTGGLDVVTLTITTSEPIDPGTSFAGRLSFTNVVGSTSNSTGTVVESGLNTSAVQHLAGVVTLSVTTDGTFTANLSTVAVAASSVKDRAGNAVAATAVTITAAS